MKFHHLLHDVGVGAELAVDAVLGQLRVVEHVVFHYVLALRMEYYIR